MVQRFGVALMAGLCAAAAGPVRAESIAGVCPDGSAFIVQRVTDVPCRRAKLVEPSELPPLRPELLPNPYTWAIDQQARDPHNPYNLIEPAEKIRALRAADSEGQGEGRREEVTERPLPAPLPELAPRVAFSASELRDVARLVELRQRVAPARLSVEDVRGRPQLAIEMAYSPAFESEVLSRLGRNPAESRVLLFAASSLGVSEFHPNFFIVQGALTFRPDPTSKDEVGFLMGTPGAVTPGATLLGYLVIPTRFDPAQSMDLWWNDLSFSAVLAPDLQAD